MDYSLGLDTNAEETKPDQPNENQTKPNFGQNDLQTAVSSFLRFNGFVEDGRFRRIAVVHGILISNI